MSSTGVQKKGAARSSSSSDSDSDVPVKKVAKKKPVASSSSDSDSDSDSDHAKKRTKPAASKSKPKKKPASSSSSSSASSSSSSSSDEDTKKKKKPAAKKAPPKKKQVSSSESESESDDEGFSKAKSKKSNAKKSSSKEVKKSSKPSKVDDEAQAAAPAKPRNAFDMLGQDEDEDEQTQSSDSEGPESPPSTPKAAAAAAAASAAAPSSSSSAPAAKGKNKKGAAADEDDLEDILNDLAIAPTKGNADAGEGGMTKAQLKRLRQKQRAEEEKKNPALAKEKEAPKAEEKKKDEKKEEKKESKKDDGKPKKGVDAIKEKIRQQREEEERRRKEEEERKRREEEQLKKEMEEAKRAEEERQRKHEERVKAREQLRREGKLLSKSEREKQQKREAFLAQLKAQGMPLPGENATAAGDDKKTQDKKDKSEKDKPHAKKGKGAAFGRKAAAEKEAERIRASRAAEDEERKKKMAEIEQQREAEEQKYAAEYKAKDDAILVALSALDSSESADADPSVNAEPEEEVVDSWDVDSEEERAKQTAAEERRSKALADKQQRKIEREAKKKELMAQREANEKQRITDLNERKKQRDLEDDKRRKAEQEERKKREAEEKERAERESAHGTGDADDDDEEKDKDKKKASGREMRSPICCILGHVDTGKTKILDRIRKTSVQAHEAGGITQQIGATFMPRENIMQQTAELNKRLGKDLDMRTPGLLVIDTPGHESFTNLRSRGSNLCDIAILVIDIMHGLEQQTIESINLLKQRKTPFVIALNKIDRCYGWKVHPNAPFQATFEQQSEHTQNEFHKRCSEAILLMAEQGLNCVPYYENTDFRRNVSVVPTSAITGEGIPDLLMLLVQLTQSMMNEKLQYVSDLSCTVLEVKVVEGHGTTIDVILVNGVLHEQDTIVVCGLQGPIVTSIRALLTPPPMAELRVKSEYVHHKVVKAAMGVKISAPGLENAVAGTQLLVVGKRDNIDELKDEVMQDLATILSKQDKSGKGVSVQASTLGSLEALLQFLSDMKVPVSGINIGPVHKKDVMRAGIMLEHKPEFAVILAFDVAVDKEAANLAEHMGVKIFTADIIYHLFDAVTKYMEDIRNKRRLETAETAVFPCVLDILPNAIFNTKNPIVVGVRVVEGIAKLGTPLCVPSKEFLYIGRITGIEKNHVAQLEAKKGEEFAMKVETNKGEQQVIFGRQFDASNQLVSKVSRESIDLLKLNYKDDLTDDHWRLVIKLKKLFDIV